MCGRLRLRVGERCWISEATCATTKTTTTTAAAMGRWTLWWMDVMNGDEQLIPVGRRPKALGGRGVTQRQPTTQTPRLITSLPTGERQPPGWNLDGQPASLPST